MEEFNMGDLLKKVEVFFEGKKSYIGAALLGLAVFALQSGWIDQATFQKIQAVLIAWGIAALRAAK